MTRKTGLCENEQGVGFVLKIRVENVGHIAILYVTGRIVIGPAIDVLRRSVLSQIGVSEVVLDLSRVSRIDARGLGLLLELREQLRLRDVKFQLMNVASLVQQILRITCLDSVFDIVKEPEIRSRDFSEPVFEETR